MERTKSEKDFARIGADHECCQIAINAFTSIKKYNPQININISPKPSKYLDVEMNIEAQSNLDFLILMNLQGDELNLHVGPFWGQWFSCKYPDVVDEFVDAVNGIISGSHRIKVISKNGVEVKALLQKPNGNTWQCIYTWSKFHWPFSKKTIHYIQNKSSESRI